jgi:hypothetical protein
MSLLLLLLLLLPRTAVTTWPAGVRPMVHWSECPEDPGKRRSAHSGAQHGCSAAAGRPSVHESQLYMLLDYSMSWHVTCYKLVHADTAVVLCCRNSLVRWGWSIDSQLS